MVRAHNAATLLTRHNIIKQFIDAVNDMLAGLAADPKYTGKVFHVNLRGTILTDPEWANELHPRNPGFAKFADKIDAALQANI